MPSCSKTSHDHYYLHRSCVPDLCHKARWLSFGGVKFQQKSLWYATPQPYGHAPTYQISLTYLKRNNYLTLRSKVKVQQVIMVCNTTLWTCTHIPNIIDLSRKKQLFDLEVKGQGPTKVIMVCDTPPYGHPPTYQISLTYLERNNHLTLKSKVKVQTKVIMVHGSIWYVTHLLWSCTNIPNIIDLSRKTKKCYGPNKKILFKKPLFDLQVKGQVPTSHYGMQHHLMDMHPHTKYHWPISKETIIWPWGQRSRSNKGHYGMRHTALWSSTHIPNIIDLSRKTKNVITRTRKYYLKNYYLTFRTKVIMVCDTPPYGHAPTYQISLTYLERNNYLTLRSKNKFPRSSLRYVTHRLMVIHPHTKYYWPISKEKNVMARTRKYYSKNIYLTFRSKVMVPRRSLWYATHRLVVMHPHIKYHWPIWKDKKVMVRTSFAEKKQKRCKRKKKSD